MLAAATDERKPNIYGGMLSQYDADQVSQPVEFRYVVIPTAISARVDRTSLNSSGPQGYGAQSGHRGTYPTSDRGHGMTMGHYSVSARSFFPSSASD